MRVKAYFGPDKYGNPVWHHRYGLSCLIGAVLGTIAGIIILVVEL